MVVSSVGLADGRRGFKDVHLIIVGKVNETATSIGLSDCRRVYRLLLKELVDLLLDLGERIRAADIRLLDKQVFDLPLTSHLT